MRGIFRGASPPACGLPPGFFKTEKQDVWPGVFICALPAIGLVPWN